VARNDTREVPKKLLGFFHLLATEQGHDKVVESVG
jgi:hypothetical protein